MPKAAHIRATWLGVFGSVASPLEQWQFGLDLPSFTVSGSETAIAGRFFGYAQTHLMSLLPPSTILRSVDVREYGPDGRQTKDAAGSFVGVGQSTNAPFPGSGSATPLLPPQCAVVVSLVTAKSGARGKGRFFLPAPAGALGSDYRLTPLQQENLALGAKGFLTAIRADAVGANPAVFSYDGTPGAEVTAIRVGRAVDTQRRRRGDMLESYRVETLA